MRYLPHTSEDIESMLQKVGVKTLEDLFSTVPPNCRRESPMDLPSPMDEWQLSSHMKELAGEKSSNRSGCCFVGAGSYEHHIPATVGALAGRSEFYTAYTPYQSEMTQGTLQAIYEYQTLITRVLGLGVANASLYDGASALAEALLMAIRVTRKHRVAISRAIHPHYRRVVRTYLAPTGYEIVEIPLLERGTTDIAGALSDNDLAAVALQSPNFFGCVEDLESAASAAHESGALFITSFTEPLAFGLFKSPGSLGADIACGEGQSFGIPQSFGGPQLGIFATREKYMRNIPGRLVGKTVDEDGKQGFVLTLATREQHIRREKATSNICTNNSLCALAASVYLASLGGAGMRSLARLNYDKAEYFKSKLQDAGFKGVFENPTFNEFVLKAPDGFRERYADLIDRDIVAGIPVSKWYPELSGCYLFCVTETKSRDTMDWVVGEMRA